ncbi:MAG: tetratricopeptide repeat protein [Stappiaceae bacterium]
MRFIFALLTGLTLMSTGFVSVERVLAQGFETLPPDELPLEPKPDVVPKQDQEQVPQSNDKDADEKALSERNNNLPRPEDDIDSLFTKLNKAETERTAQFVARRINELWLESGSDTVDLLMSRAGEAMQRKDYALSLDLLDAVIRFKPDYAEGWNRRATVYYLQGAYGPSIVDIERTLALEPRHWGAMSGLALIMNQLGESDTALGLYRQVLGIHPQSKSAKEAVDKLELQLRGQDL